LYLGTYTDVNSTIVSGYSLSQLVAELDASNNSTMLAQLADAKAKIALIYTPFDQAIILPAERPKVLDAVNALILHEATIVNIATSFGIIF
jgi:uncharacterized iron-regulated protein